MIRIENAEVVGWESAIRGMRNPMNSWEKSDSNFESDDCYKCESCDRFGDCSISYVGEKDHELMIKLANAGSVHGKYRRMIAVYADITAPLYWWKEYDTYKVGTVANSCSTMHKIHEKEFTIDDFSCEHLSVTFDCVDDNSEEKRYDFKEAMETTICSLNTARQLYLRTKSKPMKDESKRKDLMKKYWWQMIQLLPSSYNQKRTVMLNYEVLSNIYKYRRNHKLDEWRTFCEWIERLPYREFITCNAEEDDR